MNVLSKSSHSLRKAGVTKNKKKSRAELDLAARERKRHQKRRGNMPGTRTQVKSLNPANAKGSHTKDPRIGSKVPIVLDANPILTDDKLNASAQPELSLEEQLVTLENDNKLNALLDRLDDGLVISDQERKYMEKMLDKMDDVMKRLGVNLDDENDRVEDKKEDIFSLLKNSQ